ncbi:MAG: RNA ligase RtcB family protein [Clostridiales bacterium]|nr:RNA ligase RtcB family protein [Clostridiales bacterium]
MNNKTTIITNEKNWLEHTAVSQLDALANLGGVVKVVGLPDLHAGKTPVGLAAVTENTIYPHLIGNDIGCGMSLYSTSIEKKRMKLDRWAMRLNHVRELADLETANHFGEPSPIHDLGTIGGGNHFAEFQLVDEIVDRQEFDALKMDEDMVHLLVHSGSRGYGSSILSEFGGIGYEGPAVAAYFEKHDDALKWARRNRDVVAEKLVSYLGYAQALRKTIDCSHNYLEKREGVFIHRKGAVSTEIGPVVIPGSRGSLTYVVKPAENLWQTAYSISHGAGRIWARSLSRPRIRDKYDRDTIRRNKYKGRVVCHDTDLLFEEAPEAYKNIDVVIQSLLDYELINVIATLKPMLTYKG